MSDKGGPDREPREGRPAPAWGQNPPSEPAPAPAPAWGQNPSSEPAPAPAPGGAPGWGDRTNQPGATNQPGWTTPPGASAPPPGATYYPGQGGYNQGGYNQGGYNQGGYPPQAAWAGGGGYPTRATSGKAIAALVCSLGSLVIPVLPAIAGLILAGLGLSEIKRSNGTIAGRGMCIAAIIISIILIVGLVVFIVAIVILAANSSTSDFNNFNNNASNLPAAFRAGLV